MLLTLTHCKHCRREFAATHGNRDYCPNSNCQKAKKAATQKKYYRVGKDVLQGFVGNYRLFEDILRKADSKTVGFLDFQIQGFDQNGFYGSIKDETQKEWCLVKDFAFHVFHRTADNKTYVTIKRIST